MVLQFLFFISIVFSRICDFQDESVSFSQCLNGTITALYHWKYSDCENSNSPPIYNISCNIECAPGKHFGINQKHLPDCVDCPEDTYSSGNIIRFSDHDYNFDKANKYFETHCIWVDSFGTNYRDSQCTSWASSRDNTYFQVGSHNLSSKIIYQAVINPFFIRDGYITINYQTNFPQDLKGRPDCELIFRIDKEIRDNESTIHSRHLHVKQYLFTPGPHEFSIELYVHRNIVFTEDLIKINLIEINGVFHQTFECTPCKFGFSTSGSYLCSRCEGNQYLNSIKDSLCQECPVGTFAPPGSIGSQSCIPKPSCTIYDYSNDGKCIEGKQSINIIPAPADSFCTDNKNRYSYPAFLCGKCNPGFTNINGKCEACVAGYYSDGMLPCKMCPSNTYSSSEIYLKYLDEFPEFIRTYCVNKHANIDGCLLYYDGWKLINNSFVTTPNLINLVSLILEIDVIISYDNGQFEFIYESTCSSNSTLLVKTKSALDYVDLSKSSSLILPLQKGKQTIVISFSTLSTLSSCTVKIYNIKITGVPDGVSDTCNICPDGYYSDPGSHTCTSCAEGHARLKRSKCVECPENYYRDRNMNECQKCPSHTVPNQDKTGCILFDSYEIDDNYLFNMFKFDMNENFTTYESSKYYSTKGFFGPIFFNKNQTIAYLSPTSPRTFNNQFYEFEKGQDLISEKSYIFALLHINVNITSLKIHKNINSLKNSSHYRVLRSFGSEIGFANFSKNRNILASITYVNGDKCHDDPRLNYSSTINFVCDKSKNHFVPKIIDFNNCKLNILWESPFACSECKYYETSNYTTSCIKGTRYTYLEEGPDCLIIPGLLRSLKINKINHNLNDSDILNLSPFLQNERNKSVSKEKYEFVYYDTIIQSCVEIQISFIIVVSFLCIGIMAILFVLICALAARQYRSNYISLKDQAIPTSISPTKLVIPQTNRPIQFEVKEFNAKV